MLAVYQKHAGGGPSQSQVSQRAVGQNPSLQNAITQNTVGQNTGAQQNIFGGVNTFQYSVPATKSGSLSPAKTNRHASASAGEVKDDPQTVSSESPSRSPTKKTIVPQATPQVQAVPATFLDRVVQENRGLTPNDRNRLSDELYAADKFLKQSQAVGYKVSSELGKLSADRQNGALAKNVEEHIKALSDLDPASWDQYHGLQKFQTDYQYFQHQTEYIFGENPFNAGEGLLVDTVEGTKNQLSSWSEIPISNRDQRDILNIEADFQSNHETDLRHFFEWINVSLQRIAQMRQSLDPNGVVQPLPTGAVAPAPAMFTSSL